MFLTFVGFDDTISKVMGERSTDHIRVFTERPSVEDIIAAHNLRLPPKEDIEGLRLYRKALADMLSVSGRGYWFGVIFRLWEVSPSDGISNGT